MSFLYALFLFLLVTIVVCQDPHEKAKAMVQKMTLKEKITMLHGITPLNEYTGTVPQNTRLGIPPLNLNDGPQGFRDDIDGGTTCWPAAITVAATWDISWAKQWGEGMGEEFYDKGANVQLGPGLCLARVPVNGRNFEYLSGEDPYLGYHIVQNVITGIQSRNVIANAKHFVVNNQETKRNSINVEVDERTRFEMYYPPFEGAINAGVGSFMCSYNKVNGNFSCENNGTLTELKEKLGFKGWVMSDWFATHSTSINQGLDQEMPIGLFMSNKLEKAVESGRVSTDKIDESVIRILTPMYAIGIFDHAEQWVNKSARQANVTSSNHSQLARQISAAGSVLLKNNGILPLRDNVKSIAVLGLQAENPDVHGGGSGHVTPSYIVTPMDGIKTRFSQTITSGDENNIPKAVAAAKAADVAILFLGTTSSEGADRQNLSFPFNQEALVNAVIKVQPNTVVVCFNPGAVLMPWAKDASAVITMFMPGFEVGNSIADLLSGDINPSGHLPLTIPNIENEVQFSKAMYPGVLGTVHYTEKLLVGYRWYDAKDVTPHFPFGHGLSYTKFSYSDLQINLRTVSFVVTNTGDLPGAEVAQLYLGFPKSANEPPFQLKEFQKTRVLAPKEKVEINFKLIDRAFSIWDVVPHAWKLVSGDFIVHIGSSSRDIRLIGKITV